jgi:hypothetical protein
MKQLSIKILHGRPPLDRERKEHCAPSLTGRKNSPLSHPIHLNHRSPLGVGSSLRRVKSKAPALPHPTPSNYGLKAHDSLAQRNALGAGHTIPYCALKWQHTHFQYAVPSGRGTGCTSIPQGVAVGLSYDGPSALGLMTLNIAPARSTTTGKSRKQHKRRYPKSLTSRDHLTI